MLIQKSNFWFEKTIANTASAYGDGDVIGSLFEIPKALRSGGLGLLQYFSMILLGENPSTWTDKPLGVLLFSAKPLGTFTDNAPLTLSDADASKVIQSMIPLSAFDSLTTTKGLISSATMLAKPVSVKSNVDSNNKGIDDSLWAVVWAYGGAATFTQASEIILKLGIEQF